MIAHHKHSFLAAGIVAVLSLIMLGQSVFGAIVSARAADANAFDPGYIISDAKFYDSNAMTAQEVQSFLNKKVPSCEAWRDSNPSSIVCLKNYQTQTVSKSRDQYCSGYSGGQSQTAAQILDGVARSCGVSQKVLLVLLEKENALVTHTWPSPWRYKTAMGFACPDNAQCDANYYGFFNQVYASARQYRLYQAKPANYSYRIGSNTIYWSPKSSCGTSYVNIRNQATAGLYNYTPYRPNQAALNAGYGEGDGCSSYGNRNFYLYYSDWFGNPVSTTPAIDTTSMEMVYVPNGRYFVNSALDYHYSLDIPGGSKTSGVMSQLYQGNQSSAQQFQFIRQSNGSYVITNVNSGLVLDVRYGVRQNDTPIIQHAENGSSAQQWFIRKNSDGMLYLQSALGNVVLDVRAGLTVNGTSINVHEPNGTKAQGVLLTSVTALPTAKPVKIASAIDNNYVMDVRGASTANGAAVQLYASNGSKAQSFILQQVANGVFTITSALSDKQVEVAAGAVYNGAPLQQWQTNGTQAQQWFVRDAGNGEISFYNLDSSKNIDVSAGIASDSKQLSLYSQNGSAAQRWKVSESDTAVLNDGVYSIRSGINSNAVIEVAAASGSDSAPIQLYHSNSTAAQYWRVTHDSAGYVRLQNIATGKMLEVPAAVAGQSKVVGQYQSNNSLAQSWVVRRNDQGNFVLSTALDNRYVLDARFGLYSDGTRLQLQTINGTGAQQWVFKLR